MSDTTFDFLYNNRPKKSKTLMKNLFSKIDTIEKAYILGLMFNEKITDWATDNAVENTTDKRFEITFAKKNIESIDIAKQLIHCNSVEIHEYECNNMTGNVEIYVFYIPQDIIDDILYGFYFNKIFSVIPENFHIYFLRGIFENKGKIINTWDCNVNISIETNKAIISAFTQVSNCYDSSSSEELYYSKLNALDFLGKLYRDNVYLSNPWVYNEFLSCQIRYSTPYSSVPVCKVIKKDELAVVPTKANLTDSGFDLTVIKKVKDLTKTTTLYDTCISIVPPYGFYVEVYPRSSLSKSGYALANSVGIIDATYRGNIMIALTKTDPDAPDIQLPFKCCQMIIKRNELVMIEEVKTDTESTKTSRNTGGFGSTGM